MVIQSWSHTHKIRLAPPLLPFLCEVFGAIFFFPGLFFLIFSYFCSFMVVWGFGVGVLYWVFGVFSWWGLGPVVWGLLGFLGLGSLYKHKRINLGKKIVRFWKPMFFLGEYQSLYSSKRFKQSCNWTRTENSPLNQNSCNSFTLFFHFPKQGHTGQNLLKRGPTFP